jgi:ferri-bacillibactin esterase
LELPFVPTHTLAHAVRFNIQSKATGRSYAICLARPTALPGSILSNCPILVVLDSDLTFGTAVESSSLRALMGQIQPAVIVGIGYDADLLSMTRLRTKDLTTPADEGKYPEMAPLIGTEYGGADAFLEFLVDELTPDIRTRSPEASATRTILFGHSLSGLFTVHALMTRPEAFETFAANSPSLWWNDFAVLKRLQSLREKLKDRSARPRVLISVGELEQKDPMTAPPGVDLKAMQARVRDARMVDAARELATTLQNFEFAQVQFVCFAHEDHESVLAAAVGRCVTFALGRSH